MTKGQYNLRHSCSLIKLILLLIMICIFVSINELENQIYTNLDKMWIYKDCPTFVTKLFL